MATQFSCPSSACKLMLRVKVSYRGHYSTLTLSSLSFKFLIAHIIACWANEAACVKPIVVHQLHFNLLSRIKTGKCVIEDLHMEPLLLTDIVVTSRPPVLPLSNLAAATFLPHTLCVVKAFRANPVGLKSKISIIAWLVLLVHAVASSNYYIVASPCELLNIRAVICKRDRPAIIPNICFRNMRDVIKILKWRRQHMAVVDQVTKCHT